MENNRHQIHRDTISKTCAIEVDLLCAIDGLNHAVYGIGEGTESMSIDIQIGIIKGSIALVNQQVAALVAMREVNFNALP